MIRTFLFDMGNVLVHFCHDRMCEQVGELCGVDGPAMRSFFFETGLLADFERGRFTEPELQQRLEAQFARPLNLDDLRRAASDIFTLNEPIVPILDTLKTAGYRLVLLSNTSISHLNWVQQEWDVLDRFDQLVTSYEVGANKPDPPIFAAALTAAKCEPHECFYTDDILSYIEAARTHGIDAEVFTDTSALCEQLQQRNINIVIP